MKAVIFDRDGVIMDSESVGVDSTVRAFKELGIELDEGDKALIPGRHPADYIQVFLDKYSFSVEEFRKIQNEIYHELIVSAPLIKESISLIKELHRLGVPLALTTSSGLTSTLQLFKRANLEGVFGVVVTFEDCKKRKPDPEPYVITAKKLHVNPEDCVVIEDSLTGVDSAKAAGMKCVAIPDKHFNDQDFSKADLIVSSASDLDVERLKAL